MAGKPAYKSVQFKKELAELQARWPAVMISARDRATWNKTMLEINQRARRKKKRKKGLAT